jgi:hypothetical protein
MLQVRFCKGLELVGICHLASHCYYSAAVGEEVRSGLCMSISTTYVPKDYLAYTMEACSSYAIDTMRLCAIPRPLTLRPVAGLVVEWAILVWMDLV